MKARGKVVSVAGKYFLEVRSRRWELQAGGVIIDGRLEDLVGHEVDVLYSEPARFIVGLVAENLPPIMCYLPVQWHTCYLPAPWVIKGIEKQVRTNLARQLLEEKVISKETYDKLV